MKQIALALFIILFPVIACAQTTTTTTTAAPTTTTIDLNDSHETKSELRDILNRMPPEIGRVLKLDPTLWSNSTYLATYPELQKFIAAHPEVAHSPSFYLESVYVPGDGLPETAHTRVWHEMIENATILTMTIAFIIAITWLIRKFVEQRRWTRLSRVQTEVHNKLLDRFTSNEELLAYVQTPAGKRFLESAPIPLDSPRALAAPIDRILWSVQIGLVLMAGGIGLKFVSWTITDKDAIEPLSALGVIGIAIGLGFVVSSAASYFLSRRFGLWHPPATAAETND